MARIFRASRRIVKPSPGEVWLHGNPHPLAKGLVFAGGISDDHGGTRYFDFAGGKHGTLTNMDPASDWVGSPHGWALDFDGSDDRIDIGELFELGTGDFTISAYISTSTSGVLAVFGTPNDGGNRVWLWSNSGLPSFTVNGSTVSGGALPSGWFLMSAVRSLGVGKLFINTQAVAEDLANGSVTAQDFAIGNFGSLATSFPWNGKIGSCLVYNRALSPSEIAELYDDRAFNWATRPKRRFSGFSSSSGVTATLDATLGALTSSADGSVQVQGDLNQTLGALTSSADGSVDVQGDLSQTLGALTGSSTGTVDVSADLNQTLGSLTSSSDGSVDVTADLSQTLGALTLSSSGFAGSKELDLDVTLGSLTLSSTGRATAPLTVTPAPSTGTPVRPGSTSTGRQRFASQVKAVTVRPIPVPPKLVLPERLTKAFPEVVPVVEAYNESWEKFFKAQKIGETL